jgi:hypothetical protein
MLAKVFYSDYGLKYLTNSTPYIDQINVPTIKIKTPFVMSQISFDIVWFILFSIIVFNLGRLYQVFKLQRILKNQRGE